MSDSASNSPFRGKWGFNIKKSQSATENVTHDSGEVEAKSISEGRTSHEADHLLPL